MSFGRPGHQPKQFHWLHGIAVDSHGNVFTAEVDTGRRLQKFVPGNPACPFSRHNAATQARRRPVSGHVQRVSLSEPLVCSGISGWSSTISSVASLLVPRVVHIAG